MLLGIIMGWGEVSVHEGATKQVLGAPWVVLGTVAGSMGHKTEHELVSAPGTRSSLWHPVPGLSVGAWTRERPVLTVCWSTSPDGALDHNMAQGHLLYAACLTLLDTT